MFLSFDTANLSPIDRRVLSVLADPDTHAVYVQPSETLKESVCEAAEALATDADETTEADRPKRKRRTKAEMEAARAAEVETEPTTAAPEPAAMPTIHDPETLNLAEPEVEDVEPEPEDVEPEPEVEVEVEADLLGDDAPTMADVMALAKSLMDAGKAGRLKAILNHLDVAKVPELEGDAEKRVEFMARASKIAAAVEGE